MLINTTLVDFGWKSVLDDSSLVGIHLSAEVDNIFLTKIKTNIRSNLDIPLHIALIKDIASA